MELTGFDYVIIAIFFLSILFGLLRGFISELIGLLTWIAAFIVATLYSSKVATMFMNSPMFKSTVSSSTTNDTVHQAADVSLFALGVSFLCIFLVVMLIGAIINVLISRLVNGGAPGFVSRFLGGLLGFARGYLVVLLVVFLIGFTAFTDHPAWKDSKYVPYFTAITKQLSERVMPEFEKLKKEVQKPSKSTEE